MARPLFRLVCKINTKWRAKVSYFCWDSSPLDGPRVNSNQTTLIGHFIVIHTFESKLESIRRVSSIVYTTFQIQGISVEITNRSFVSPIQTRVHYKWTDTIPNPPFSTLSPFPMIFACTLLLPAFGFRADVALAKVLVDVDDVDGPCVGLAALMISEGMDAGTSGGFFSTSAGSVKFLMSAAGDTSVGLASCHSWIHCF